MEAKLSKNFTLEELVESDTAIVKQINNTPSAEVLANLQLLVNNVLQPVRELFGRPIHVNSGYRSVELNKAVGGAANSQHVQGRAADISAGGKAENKALFDLIAGSGIVFDQLIDEYDYRWVHVSYKAEGNRKQVLHLK
jgi:uncharacterized protein YcbK (DUF882 family)